MLHDSWSLEPIFQIMDSNLIARPSEDIVANWGLQTGTLPRLILMEIGKLRLLTKSSLMGLRKDWMMPRGDG